MAVCCGGGGLGGSISTPQAENKKYQSVGTRSRVLLDEEDDAIVSRKQIYRFCNVRRAAVYVLGNY